jgi:hypothetical protein
MVVEYAETSVWFRLFVCLFVFVIQYYALVIDRTKNEVNNKIEKVMMMMSCESFLL